MFNEKKSKNCKTASVGVPFVNNNQENVARIIIGSTSFTTKTLVFDEEDEKHQF